MTVQLTRDQARRIAVRAARLDAEPVADLDALAHDLDCVRVELTSIVAPAAEHVALSRRIPGFRPADLDRALANGRLFERGWMLRPIDRLPLFLAGMRTWLDRSGSRGWVEANATFRQRILDRLGDLGPLTSRDVPDEATVPWPSSGWTNDRNVTKMLDCLHMAGDLAVVGRVGRLRVWDLAANVLPPVAEVPAGEARRRRSENLLRAFGVARDSIAIVPSELHGFDRTVGVAAEIEGVAGRWRVDPAYLDGDERDGFSGRTVVLSPFDRLLSDRVRVERLFDFDYALEIYKPQRTRRWGDFGLPVLHDERLVGKVDARADRDAGTLTVHAVHEDDRFSPEMRDGLDAELERFARGLGLALRRA
ncbi:DNA glycosylase AlkZ-like family protein [Schumannella sp. 10F1B-5-1]|uniref:DNA glycosylase AlkZ-like family protein n=1 Tax=Schumannella sp. 10F1B-5-1 TaxID=2590780 RepID=UPI00113230DB|nr:crosslink repair DNA glycosylase YcaQ family protein [Schumannella sp. 10F1B-5-1]TPW78365.1 winged helix-turn-helix domain-containing protein [Schumannella sp. 10F1B-5-1]